MFLFAFSFSVSYDCLFNIVLPTSLSLMLLQGFFGVLTLQSASRLYKPYLTTTTYYCLLLATIAYYYLLLPTTSQNCLPLPTTAYYCLTLPTIALYCLLLPITAYYRPPPVLVSTIGIWKALHFGIECTVLKRALYLCQSDLLSTLQFTILRK